MNEALRAARKAGEERIASLAQLPSDILSVLEKRITKVGGVRPYAREIGVSPAFVSAVRSKKKPPSGKLLADLGYEPVRLKLYKRITTHDR